MPVQYEVLGRLMVTVSVNDSQGNLQGLYIDGAT